MNAETLHQLRAVGLDGLDRQIEPLGNVAGAVALGDQLQHLALARRQFRRGRRVRRAAMNEIFDYGRPASIVLAALVERSGRELPIEAQVVGAHMELAANRHVKLGGPQPLTLKVMETNG